MRLHVQPRMSTGLPQRRRGPPRWVHSGGCTTKPDVPVTKRMGFGGPCSKERLWPRWLGGPALSQTHSREQHVPSRLPRPGRCDASTSCITRLAFTHAHTLSLSSPLFGSGNRPRRGLQPPGPGGPQEVGIMWVPALWLRPKKGLGGGSRAQGHPSPLCLALPEPCGPGAGRFHPE